MRAVSVIVLLMVVMTGCFEPPELPNEPKISFNNVRYTEVDGAADSLILTLNFEDGDGDIGLEPNDVFPPYHSFNVVVEVLDNGAGGFDFRTIYYGDTAFVEPLYLAVRVGVDEAVIVGEYEFDGELPPFGCEDYLVIPSEDTVGTDVTDTVLIEKNLYNKNIYVDFFRKVRGEYTLINDEFSQGACIELFNSRFPIFDEENLGRTLTGTLSFSMLSQGFETIFRNDSIKMSFFIIDRALNQSNIAETNDFVLSDIRVN